MKANYEFCLNLLLKDEGGYTNDPSDSGGATNYGITIGDYRRYINRNGTPTDVKNMTVNQAKEIYRERYWNAMDCDSLSSGVDYTVFDYAVNSGVGRARKVLQKFSDKKGTDLINAINDERTAFLKALAASQPKDQKFLRGWLNRVNRVRVNSLQLAKKDNVSGPAGGIATGAAATAGVWVAFSNYIHTHPYVSVAAIAGVAVVIGLVIHFIRNRGK